MGILTDMYNVVATRVRATTSSATAGDVVATANIPGLLRPVSDKLQLLNQADWGREYRFWCDAGVSIRPGDKFTIGGVEYAVAGDPYYEDLEGAAESHMEIRLSRRV